jgi:Heterokaryon incompatibility protein (HET)
MNSIGRFFHEPFQFTDGNVRFLELLPGTTEEQICCNLSHDDMERHRKYEALSYTWGPAKSKGNLVTGTSEPAHRDILCNGKLVSVTANLEAALRRLRQTTAGRSLWVDAICINQADLDEKRYALIMMNKIYYLAQRVVIWLGEGDSNSDVVMAHMATIEPKPYMEAFKVWYRDEELRMDGILNQELDAVPRITPEFASALNDFFSRAWFKRVWVQQEAAAGEETIVVCGQKEVDWLQVFAFAWQIYCSYLTCSSGLVVCDRTINAIKLVLTIQKNRISRSISPNKPTLLEILRECRQCEATEPIDKLFALLHLGRDKDLARIVPSPNYRLPFEKIANGFAIRCLASYSLDILKSAGRSLQCNEIQDPTRRKIRSWASDFSGVGPKDLPNHSCWRAAGNSCPSFRVTRTAKSDVLIIRGAILDSIAETGGVLQPKLAPNEPINTVSLRELERRWYMLAWKSQVSLERDSTREIYARSLKDSYWRTLIANTEASGRMARKDYSNSFDLWLKFLSQYSQQTERESFSVALSQVETFTKRQFCITKLGLMCLAPSEARKGDLACILSGYHVPWIIRRVRNQFELIGECYVHGAMEGGLIGQEGVSLFKRSRKHANVSLYDTLGGKLLSSSSSSQFDVGGSLPPGWKEEYDTYHKRPTFHYRYKENDSIDTRRPCIEQNFETTTDPRTSDMKAGPVPRGWRVGQCRFQSGTCSYEDARKEVYFISEATGETTWMDPCLSTIDSGQDFPGFVFI